MNSDFHFQLDEFYLDLREDGKSISFLEKKAIEQTPYPGLRPFKTSEFQLFNGRDGQAEELIKRLKKNKFLSVIGSSGTGKSSLIRAGLIPQLLAGYLHEAGTNWDVAICRPGKDPVLNLAVALARTICRSNKQEDINEELTATLPLLKASIYGILEVNELLNPPAKEKKEKSNLLIIIDQFEELFRYNREDLRNPDIENHFVNLLLKAASNTDAAVYVIITMRSEFLGECVKYRGLPEVINEGQYLVPQLSREQIKEVIEDPILLAGKKIAPGLVELLVNEIEESKTKKDLDQLPVLQHALMRTYREFLKQEGATEIQYEHYIATGGLEKALANHAESRYKKLGDGIKKESFKQKIARIIFQALTDASADQKRGRRPTELKTLYAIAGSINATAPQVDEVINHFRDTDTSFIMPPINTGLYPELILDISHESLMRQWERLKGWVSEEADNGKMLLRLSEYQVLNKQGIKDYLDDKELQQIADWYHSFKPQDAWSARYTPLYTESYAYLKKSEDRMKFRKWRKKIFIALGVIAIAAIIYTVDLINSKQEARHKAAATLSFLLDKRKKAISQGNKLQALIYTVEAMQIKQKNEEQRQAFNDSLFKNCIKNELFPNYELSKIFFGSSEIVKASPGAEGKSVFIWTADSLLAELDMESGNRIKMVKYHTPEEPEEPTSLIVKQKWTLVQPIGLKNKADTILIDSSIWYKKKFVEIFETDAIGMYQIPEKVRILDGAAYSTDKLKILTWGKNTEAIWDAVDIWNESGEPIDIGLTHDGIKGAFFSNDAKQIITWGLDSTLRIWKTPEQILYTKMPPALFKLKIEVATGVEMKKDDYTIQIITPGEYQKRKEQLAVEEDKWRKSLKK